jgi:hypothetical protein
MELKIMATKVQQQQATEAETTTALSVFTELFQPAPAKQSTTDLLPQVKQPCPVELGPKYPAVAIYRLGLTDGTTWTPIASPAIYTVIAAREASRKEQTDSTGKVTYERAFKSLKTGYDASHALWEQHQQDPDAQKGTSYLVGIIDAAGKATIAEMPVFKVAKDYYARPLSMGRISSGLGLLIKIDDHTPNVVTAKNGKTQYLAPHKFSQWEQVQLTNEQLTAIKAALKEVEAKFNAWCMK